MELEHLDYSSEGTINKDISYELSALLDADSLFYGVLDYSRRLKKAAYLTLDREVQDPIEKEYKIRKVKIGILSPIFTLVPAQEFSSSHAADLIQHNHLLPDGVDHLIRNDYCEKFNIRVVYAVTKQDLDFLTTSFEAPSLHHFITACIEDLDVSVTGVQFRVILLSGKMTIVVHEGEKLLLANTYAYTDTATFLYFVTLVFKQLGLDRLDQLITISGYLSISDEIIATIKKYYAQVQFVDHSVILDSDVPRHYYHPLYLVSKCA